jgi:hypothetical protein
MCQPVVHHRQSAGNNLCAFYSLKHFLLHGGNDVEENSFVSQAARFYMNMDAGVRGALGINTLADAKNEVRGGNDPGTIWAVLKDSEAEMKDLKPNATDVKIYKRIIIALRNQQHFISILKCAPHGQWWNYDSLLAAPAQINDINQFLTDNPGHKYFCAR